MFFHLELLIFYGDTNIEGELIEGCSSARSFYIAYPVESINYVQGKEQE